MNKSCSSQCLTLILKRKPSKSPKKKNLLLEKNHLQPKTAPKNKGVPKPAAPLQKKVGVPKVNNRKI